MFLLVIFFWKRYKNKSEKERQDLFEVLNKGTIKRYEKSYSFYESIYANRSTSPKKRKNKSDHKFIKKFQIIQKDTSTEISHFGTVTKNIL